MFILALLWFDWFIVAVHKIWSEGKMKFYIEIPTWPQYVKDFPIGMDSNEEIWHGDELEVTLFGIWEEHLNKCKG